MSRVLESETQVLSIELFSNTMLNGERNNWSWLDACVSRGKGKGNLPSE